MTHKDWLCPICKGVLYKSSLEYMVCVHGHSKAQPAWGVRDLPQAYRTTSENFWIWGIGGNYRYVPCGHKTALDQAPAEGDVVARVVCRGKWKARLFRKKGLSRR